MRAHSRAGCAGAGGQGGGRGRAVEDAVELGAVGGGKVPRLGGLGRAEALRLELGGQRAEQAELGAAGDQQQGHAVQLCVRKAAAGQQDPVREQVGETAHPNVPAVGHEGAQPGRVQIVEPAADVLAAGQQPVRRRAGIGEKPVLHRQRGKGAGSLPGAGRGIGHGQPAREGDSFVEPPRKIGACQHGQHVPAARRKAHGGDVPAVPAERGDVLLHPVQRLGGVQQGIVAGGVGAVLKGGQGVEAQQPQPVPHRNKDAAGLFGQAAAGQLQSGAGAVAPAVEVDRHRQAGRAVGGVDVQFETVLGAGGHPVAGLQGHGAGGGAVQRAGPGGGVLRGLPAQGPRGLGAVGHPVPDQAPAVLAALHRAVGGGADRPLENGLGGRGVPGRARRQDRGRKARRRQRTGFQKAAPCQIHVKFHFLPALHWYQYTANRPPRK